MKSLIVQDPREIFYTSVPQRVVSLVPSFTATMEDLGLQEALIGITDYCTPSKSKAVCVGGPKTTDLERIAALHPDLVVANQEENDRRRIEQIAAMGIPVWLSFPLSIQDAIHDLWTLAGLFRSDFALERVDLLERSVEWAERASPSRPAFRFFCPIWQDHLEDGFWWWMTFNERTYSHDVLRLFNGENIFAHRERKYPFAAEFGKAPEELSEEQRVGAHEKTARDTRYPRVSQQEILLGQPDIILLPDEPYAYQEESLQQFIEWFAETPAGMNGNIFLVDGSWLHWPGTRLAHAMIGIQEILDQVLS
jgi:ABC-type Fe3+-hydroxamate transport system substrate-binding protein